MGSTRVLTDATGAVTDSYDYDDYGALQAQTGTTRNDFLYAGEQFDQEAGLYYNRARYLDVNTGRFTGLDPYAGNLSQPITLNKYTYANSDPINGRDPSGLQSLTETEAAAAINEALTTINGYVQAIGRLQQTVETVKGFLDLAAFAQQIFGTFESGGLGSPGPGQSTQLPIKADFSCLPEALGRGFAKGTGIGLLNWAAGLAPKARSVTEFDILMPNLAGGLIPVSAGITGPRITLAGRKIPIRARFGGPSGTGIVGFGVSLDKFQFQLWRADLYGVPDGHGGKSGMLPTELVPPFNDPICTNPRYSFHVYQWGKQGFQGGK